MKGAGADKRCGAFLLFAVALFFIFIAGYARSLSITPVVTTQHRTPSANAGPQVLSTLTQPKKPFSTSSIRKKSSAMPGFPVDINSAGKEDLMMLPGVGEKTALRIIETRARLKGFKSVNDILMVKYIGEKKFEKLAGYIIVKGKGHE
ncbi:helix-hairpin-helix domain-containing protein [bacterium]|nr:MAG: helix-hairpin-helix domain-containing protein [bacterium]